jgi:hypothetical protein
LITNTDINVSAKGYIYFNKKLGRGHEGLVETKKGGVMSKYIGTIVIYGYWFGYVTLCYVWL